MKELAFVLIFVLIVGIPVGMLATFLNILGNFVADIPLQQPVVVAVANPSGPGTPVPTVTGTDLQEQIISIAKTWLNVRYLWGGCSHNGIDCSCFVQLTYAAVHISVPRNTVQQVNFDRPIPRSDIRVGDTLFFNNTCTGCGANPTHEGLYIGGGLMIQAGDPVQISSINTPYWISHYASAGRPPGL